MTRIPRFQIYRDDDRKWRYRLTAGNGEKVTPSEAYATRAGVLRAIAWLKHVAPLAGVGYVDPKDEPRARKT